MYIDDCTDGTTGWPHSDIVEPINIGSDELVTINRLIDIVEEIAGIKLKRRYNLERPRASAAATATTPDQEAHGLGAVDPARGRHGDDLPVDRRRDDLGQGLGRQRPAPRRRRRVATTQGFFVKRHSGLNMVTTPLTDLNMITTPSSDAVENRPM